MTQMIHGIRGMHDILPEDTPYWSLIEQTCRSVSGQYAYREVRFPMLERVALFQRSIGEATDIVEKEMYVFPDRNEEYLALRPEGTAGCIRMGIEHHLFYHQVQRLWYLGPMFRYERPQKGRYRQFHQWGVEAIGMSGPECEAELLLMTHRLWDALTLSPFLTLQMNTLGNDLMRACYRDALVTYFKAHYESLDVDSRRRLETNPLRILDSKQAGMQELIAQAPDIRDYLDEQAFKRFEALCRILDQLNIAYTINPRLVRGLDYYTDTVFEWVTTELGAQGTVCAGGRYDRLVEQLGGSSTPAVGFAAGLERMVLLLKKIRHCAAVPDLYFVLIGEQAVSKGWLISEQCRQCFPELKIAFHLQGGGFKRQFRAADKSGARWAVIIAASELETNQVTLKNLRQETEQISLTIDALMIYLREHMTDD